MRQKLLFSGFVVFAWALKCFSYKLQTTICELLWAQQLTDIKSPTIISNNLTIIHLHSSWTSSDHYGSKNVDLFQIAEISLPGLDRRSKGYSAVCAPWMSIVLTTVLLIAAALCKRTRSWTRASGGSMRIFIPANLSVRKLGLLSLAASLTHRRPWLDRGSPSPQRHLLHNLQSPADRNPSARWHQNRLTNQNQRFCLIWFDLFQFCTMRNCGILIPQGCLVFVHLSGRTKMPPGALMLDLCQSVTAGIWQRSTSTRPSESGPQTSASLAMHQGAELVLVIRTDSQWGAGRRESCCTSWLLTNLLRQAAWHDTSLR